MDKILKTYLKIENKTRQINTKLGTKVRRMETLCGNLHLNNFLAVKRLKQDGSFRSVTQKERNNK